MSSNSIAPMALTIAEACSASRCGRTTIYELIKTGELPAKKRGKRTIILESDLRRYLENLPALTTDLKS